MLLRPGLTKLQKVCVIPVGRKSYRGMAGVLLPRVFWEVISLICSFSAAAFSAFLPSLPESRLIARCRRAAFHDTCALYQTVV